MEIESTKPLETPVLFVVFNRPAPTRRVFDAIRSARPVKLFIAADGPRKEKSGEDIKCAEVRKIVSEIDWQCEVSTLFRDENLGCGQGVSSAITWFFQHVTEGIILEDDTLPSPDFFRFCSEMLMKYRDDTRVMEVSGSCLPSRLGRNGYEYSYFFSNWDYIWGWATWRRSWRHFDYTMKQYEKVRAMQYFHKHYTSLYETFYMKHSFDRSYYQNQDVTWWSLQWGFARKINSGLVVVPLRNMIVNLGFGQDATNTKEDEKFSFLEFEKMNFPLIHPEFVIHDRVTDDEIFRNYFTTAFSRTINHVKHMAIMLGLEPVYTSVKQLKDRMLKFFSEMKKSSGNLAEVRRMFEGK